MAALITTALIAAPLMSYRAALPAQSFARPVAAVAIAETRMPLAYRETPRAPATSLETRVSEPAASVAVVSDMPRPSGRKPLSRLTGWLIGDGSQTIRPFPMIASSRP